MKRFWLLSVFVFVIGVGVGSYLSHLTPEETEPLPYFTQVPTLPSIVAPTAPPPTAAPLEKNENGLPCALQYTALVAQSLVSYDGAYWEDGTGDDVFGVAALMLTNNGTIGMEYVQISLTLNGRTLSFDGTFIPPRSTVLLLEESRQPYESGPISDCRCRTAIPGNFDIDRDAISVEDEGLAGIKVTNVTDRTLSKVDIYYKHHYRNDDLYIGGITYSTSLQNLAPGETRVLYPFRYAADYSQAVAITVESFSPTA